MAGECNLLCGDPVWILDQTDRLWCKGTIQNYNNDSGLFSVNVSSHGRSTSLQSGADGVHLRNSKEDHKPHLNLYNLKYFNSMEVASYLSRVWNREDQKLVRLIQFS